MTRRDCLMAAIYAVCKDRQNTYGKPEDNFKLIADLWSDYIGMIICEDDVANMMILLKIARAKTGTYHTDNYVDIAGYAACACESLQRVYMIHNQDKPKFRLEDYPGNCVMHCDTSEKAEIFCNFLHNLGRKWIGGSLYKDETSWEEYKKDTVYHFNIGTYTHKEYAEEESYTILEFDDFDW